jgi:hypothetical protein
MEDPFEITEDRVSVQKILAGKISAVDEKAITEIAEEFSKEFIQENLG